jgi:hypothetical protein
MADACDLEMVFCWNFFPPMDVIPVGAGIFAYGLNILGPIFVQNLIETVIAWKLAALGNVEGFYTSKKNLVL